jgi:calcium permeable stress-gated cation channel
VAWVFIAFVYFMVTKESIYYINVRNAYQLSLLYARRISSRTVLFTSVPKEYVNEAKLRELFGNKVKKIWLMSDTKTLSEKVEQRDEIGMKLEAGETALIKLSNEARIKSIKAGGRNVEEGPTGQTDVEAESGSAASRWIQPKQRPTHRIGKFGLIGKKVDTINWCRSELQRLIPEIEAEQATHKAGEATMAAAVFIEFHTQADAQAAFQDGGGNQMTLSKAPRVVGMTPDDVVWTNLSMNSKVRIIRNAITIAFVVLTIIYWYVAPRIHMVANIDSFKVYSSRICWRRLQYQLSYDSCAILELHQQVSQSHPRCHYRSIAHDHARCVNGSAPNLSPVHG